jgi:hypothetical protein
VAVDDSELDGGTMADDIQFVVSAMEREIIRGEHRLKIARRMTIFAWATTISIAISTVMTFYLYRKTFHSFAELVHDVEDILLITDADQKNNASTQKTVDALQKAVDMDQKTITDLRKRLDALEKAPHSLTILGPDRK